MTEGTAMAHRMGAITETLNTLFTVLNFLKCVRTSSCFPFAFKTLDISHGSVATHLRCDGIFSDVIITDILLILTE